MIRLILVRHGNTFETGTPPFQIGAKTDLHLTAEGKSQALQLGRYFLTQEIVPKAIFAGTLKRQIETADILSQTLGLSQVHLGENALTEIDYGLWEGLTPDLITLKWKIEHEEWVREGKWPLNIFGGTLEDHLKNIANWLAHVQNSYQEGDTVMAIASQGILRLLHPGREKEPDLKVKTGHFCEIHLHQNMLHVETWNQRPL